MGWLWWGMNCWLCWLVLGIFHRGTFWKCGGGDCWLMLLRVDVPRERASLWLIIDIHTVIWSIQCGAAWRVCESRVVVVNKKKYLHFSLRDDMFHQFIHSALLLFASLHDVCCAMTWWPGRPKEDDEGLFREIQSINITYSYAGLLLKN